MTDSVAMRNARASAAAHTIISGRSRQRTDHHPMPTARARPSRRTGPPPTASEAPWPPRCGASGAHTVRNSAAPFGNAGWSTSVCSVSRGSATSGPSTTTTAGTTLRTSSPTTRLRPPSTTSSGRTTITRGCRATASRTAIRRPSTGPGRPTAAPRWPGPRPTRPPGGRPRPPVPTAGPPRCRPGRPRRHRTTERNSAMASQANTAVHDTRRMNGARSANTSGARRRGRRG